MEAGLNEIYMWLDDERRPPSEKDTGVAWTWVKTHDAALELLKAGNVVFASLDHDLCDEHYRAFDTGELLDPNCKEKTGYETLCWMEEHNVWPEDGVRIHTMNTSRKPVMIGVVLRAYGRTFQFQMHGTHRI